MPKAILEMEHKQVEEEMPDQVNLYWVGPSQEDWGYYVFAISGNRAKSLCTGYQAYYLTDYDYINLRVGKLVSNVGGETDIVVEAEDEPGYDRVLVAGCAFRDDEEGDETYE